MTLGEHFDMEREEGRKEGLSQGLSQGEHKFILELLEDLGKVDQSLKDRLDQISDETELTRLLKLAAKATNLEEFEKEL